MNLQRLADVLIVQCQVRNMYQGLDDAIALLHEGVKLPPPTPETPAMEISLAEALGTRFMMHGVRMDLDQAIEYLVRSLNLCPPGSPWRVTSLHDLAMKLLMRYKVNGQPLDLETAINHLIEATQLPAEQVPSATCISNLGRALTYLYQRTGVHADLHKAIDCYKQADVQYPKGHPEQMTNLCNLGCALQTRFEALGKVEDLDSSVSAFEEALGSQLIGPGGRPMLLNNLGMSLLSRFQIRGWSKDLDDCISFLRESLTLWSVGGEVCPECVCPGHALLIRLL